MDAMMLSHRKDGISACRSAALMSKHFGIEITRAAVLGRAHRLKLPSPHTGTTAQSRGATKARQRERLSDQVVGSRKFTGENISKFLDVHPDDVGLAAGPLETRRDNQCRFPIGDPQKPGFGYCKRDRELGSYCMAHHKRIFNGAPVVTRQPDVPEKVKETETV